MSRTNTKGERLHKGKVRVKSWHRWVEHKAKRQAIVDAAEIEAYKENEIRLRSHQNGRL